MFGISGSGLACARTAGEQHVIVKQILYLMCLPIKTDYVWLAKHKLIMWWIKCQSAGHMPELLPCADKMLKKTTTTEQNCSHIKPGFSLESIQVKINPTGTMNLFVWSGCALKWLMRELDFRAAAVRNPDIKKKSFSILTFRQEN